MIKEITFKNYRSFKSKQSIKIKPITVLMGPNSAGKSSILKLLPLLKQSYFNGNWNSFINTEGPEITCSNIKSLINNRCNDKDRLEIEIIFGSSKKNHLSYKISTNNMDSNKITLGLPSGKVEFINGTNIKNVWGKKHKLVLKNSSLLKHGMIIIQKAGATLKILGNKAKNDEWIKLGKYFESRSQDALQSQLDNYMPQMAHVNGIRVNGIYSSTDQSYEAEHSYENHDLYTIIKEFELRQYEYSSIEELRKAEKDLPEKLKFLDFTPTYDSIETVRFWSEGYKEQIEDIIKRLEYLDGLQKKLKDDEYWIPYSKIIYHYIMYFINYIVNRTVNFFKLDDHNYIIGKIDDYLHNSTLNQIQYIQPLRPQPKLYYSFDDLKEALSNKFIFPIFGTSSNQSIYEQSLLDSNKYYFRAINESFKKMEMGYRLKVKEITKQSEHEKLYSIVVTDIMTNKDINYANVGTGVSQVLPIVSALHRHNLLVVEQPELHLHPKAQSKLGAEIIRLIKTPHLFIDELPKKSNIVMETHSEHIIRAIQLGIAKGDISKDDVAIYFVDKYKNGNSFIRELELREKGRFKEDWPGGFFEDGYKSVSEFLKYQ